MELATGKGLMAEYAPQAIRNVYPIVKNAEASAVFSGIIGSSTSRSYHRSRNKIRAAGDTDNYSVVAPQDKLGDGDAASALDTSFSTAAMKRVTKRLMDACLTKDPRINCIREFLGTLNGTSVTGYNRIATGSGSRSRIGVISGDSSHLWHVHVSGLRAFVNDEQAWLGVAHVMAGVPLQPPVVPTILIDGVEYDDIASVSVGSVNGARDRGVLSRSIWYVQTWLNDLNLTSPENGYWEPETQAALNAFRKGLGWDDADSIGGIGLTSLSALATEVGTSKPVRA
jgi:hypothetical protein